MQVSSAADQNQSATNALGKMMGTSNQQAMKVDTNKATSGANGSTAMANNNTPVAQKTNKKRDREEAFGGKIEEPSIEEILQQLKLRVLNNETLHNFKKEINQLVELIEKKDPKMERLPEIVSHKLAQILGKPEQEILYMLKRIHLLEKKNKKKTEYERGITLLK